MLRRRIALLRQVLLFVLVTLLGVATGYLTNERRPPAALRVLERSALPLAIVIAVVIVAVMIWHQVAHACTTCSLKIPNSRVRKVSRSSEPLRKTRSNGSSPSLASTSHPYPFRASAVRRALLPRLAHAHLWSVRAGRHVRCARHGAGGCSAA